MKKILIGVVGLLIVASIAFFVLVGNLDKILKGANPEDIPVEVNSEIEFVINLKTAEALGLAIAPEVLFQATKVIR